MLYRAFLDRHTATPGYSPHGYHLDAQPGMRLLTVLSPVLSFTLLIALVHLE